MRKFLPIKGPGGRYLTSREKVALLILGVTLVLCVLTVLAGETAYASQPAQNPVFSIVAFFGRTLGGGVVAFYALVLIWCGLIYFKGEKVANFAPFGGRIFAACAVTVGISGALGIAQLQTAGDLGVVVGSALQRTFGAGLGFPLLLGLMLLGIHLAGQGTWNAFREPIPVTAGTAPAPSGGFGFDDRPEQRFHQHSLPDDGDPTADERSLAVTQAMEEIERNQGVTIVDVEPGEQHRQSIGEEVEAAPPPPPESDEARLREGLARVEEALGPPAAPAEAAEAADAVDEAVDEVEEAEETAAEDRYVSGRHGLVPVPPATEETELVEEELGEEEEEEDEYEEGDTAEYDEEEEEEYEEDEDEEAEDDVSDEDEEEEEGEYAEADDEVEDDDEYEDEEEYEEDDTEAEVEEPVAAAEADEEEAEAQADGFAEDGDPYARGGLLRRMQQARSPDELADDDRPYTTFDWRGRPIG